MLDTFDCKVRELAANTFDMDSDGDIPVDIRVIDRTRYERCHYFYIPYEGNADNPAEHESVLDSLMSNLAISTEAINRWHRVRRFDKQPGVVTATDENLTTENQKLVKINDKLEAEMREIRKDVGAKIRRDSAVKDAREKRDQMTDALHHLWHCEIDECDECETHKKQQRLEGKRPDRKVRKETETRS